MNKILKSTFVKEWLLPLLCNLALVIACFTICRLAFMLENWGRFHELTASEMLNIYRGGLRFDWATICYVNALYILLITLLLPLFGKQWYRQTTKITFVTLNALCWVINLMDSVYFQFIGRRCTASVFVEFRNDNVTDILGIEFLSHWYFVLLFILMVLATWRLYRHPLPHIHGSITLPHIGKAVGALLFSTVFIIGGIRGGFDPEQRPLNNKEAKEYTSRPVFSALVLNTPYSIIRTIGKRAFPHYTYFTDDELAKHYSPLHAAAPVNPAHPNVVIIILESFGSEYSAFLNGKPANEGYMPFLDSLMQQGMTFDDTFSNGHCSIDGQASVHLSIPLMVESFFTSHAALNDVCGAATELKDLGYHTAYFHGADNGSLSLDGFSRSVGYDSYFGRTEFADDTEWDHHWGIWDEPFMQFYAHKMSEMKEPFITTIFTVTSHHPFQIPEKYKRVYTEGKMPIYKTIRYTDMALRKFFEYAKTQTWYSNTLFVLTGDHTNQSAVAEYQTDLGTYRVPIVFYHPSDSTFQSVHRGGIAQHIDIMPTVLGYTGCKHPYVAFGNDLLHTAADSTYHIGFGNDTYQITGNGMLLQFDGEKTTALYDISKDVMLQHNLLNDAKYAARRQPLETKLKAVVQSYMERMNNNQLVVKK
ncbi:MAG: sulfatase-like hydrolase/transferase [Bacteroidaceae bacterium]|nr:sulfatase-like hydrolase/transferase [Bacteroidaceae bacterium]